MPLNHTSKYAELTDEQFLLIGKVVVEFSNIEFLLGVLLGRLLITPEFLARTYTDQMNAFGLLEAIDNALKIHVHRFANKIVTEKNAVELSSILEDIKSFRPLRNKFAHFCWTRSNNEEIFGTMLSGKLPTTKKSNDYILVKNTELIQIYDKAYTSVDRLEKIIKTLPELLDDKDLIGKLTPER